MAKMQVAHIGAKSLLLMLLASSVATLTAGTNTDCVTNAISFTLQMEYVDIDGINYASTMQTYVANALDTLSDCVTIQQPYAAGTTSTTATPTPARRRLSATSPSFSPGIAGVVSTMTTEQLQAALQTQNFKSQVCGEFGTDSSKCDITDVLAAPVTTIGTTTTTTEMPWGWPWWVWFLIYCCCLAICGGCGGAGAGAAGGGGSKKKKKSPNDNSRFDEPSRPQYEVVDVPGPGPHSGQYPPQQPPYNSGPQYSGYY